MNENTQTNSATPTANPPSTTTTATQQPSGTLLTVYNDHTTAFQTAGICLLLAVGAYLLWSYLIPSSKNDTYGKR